MAAVEITQDADRSHELLRTAAEHASTTVPVATPSDVTAGVPVAMRRRGFDSAAVIAVSVTLVLPRAFQKPGRDPAFGAGPPATVVQDLPSIVVPLGIARAIVG